MTPPPFSFELIVTGLCLITLQGPKGMETGVHFQFLNAPGNSEVCGTQFDESHVPSLTFDLEDLGDGSTGDYTSYRTPDGHYIGVYSLAGEDLCLKPVPDEKSGVKVHPFHIKRGREIEPTKPEPKYDKSFDRIAVLKEVDDRAGNYSPGADSFAAILKVEDGELAAKEVAKYASTGKAIVWTLTGNHVPRKPDFPKALDGAATVTLMSVADRVELVRCQGESPILVFQSNSGRPVQVVAANLPKRKMAGALIDPMAHFLWYYNLFNWEDNTENPGECPDDAALPAAQVVLPPGGIGGITGSSVFCPPVVNP